MLLKNCNRWSGIQTLINKFNCKIGIEVGTRECLYADFILRNTEIETLYALDIIEIKERTKAVRDIYGSRFQFLLGASPQYANNFIDSFFDIIYIDAGHTYDEVKADLNAWWPKLKNGYIFMGDDYMINQEDDYGIIKAVNEFVQEKNQNLYVTGLNIGPNCFKEFEEWGRFNSIHAKKNDRKEPNLFCQNVQWYIIKC